MIRLATADDAEQLFLLNEQFNGKNETILDNIKESLSNNKQELVVVAEESGILIGFVCVQIKYPSAIVMLWLKLRKYLLMKNIEEEKTQAK
jgi:hypothetical protein